MPMTGKGLNPKELAKVTQASQNNGRPPDRKLTEQRGQTPKHMKRSTDL
jgi:hypothetical protein